MICHIAELFVDVPESKDLVQRCKEYEYHGKETPQIIIREAHYRKDMWNTDSEDIMKYMESGEQFYAFLVKYNGLMLHASAVEYNGQAYLFSGPCGVGKSTHTHLWQQVFGPAAQVFNDDKPALRYVDGKWYAYGTPWCGKDGINQNKKVPLAGICFLEQGKSNSIRRLSSEEAMKKILSQTRIRFNYIENLDKMLRNVEELIKAIPIFELKNKADEASVMLSYGAMYHGAKEIDYEN